MLDETTAHILGGGIGGTIGAICTCPLELIKTRFQSSQGRALLGSTLVHVTSHQMPLCSPSMVNLSHQPSPSNPSATVLTRSQSVGMAMVNHAPQHSRELPNLAKVPTVYAQTLSSPTNKPTGLLLRSKIIRCLLEVGRMEGYCALFKGLVPTLIGVLPSRCIYFCAYHEGQNFFQRFFPDGHSGVFMLSAGCGSITASTVTNPIWYVKTRLQLDSRPSSSPATVMSVIRSTWREYGIRGFYRGISASYVGSLETALNFVLYENVKGALLLWGQRSRLANGTVTTDVSGSGGAKEFDLMEGDGQQFRGTMGGSKLSANSDMFLCMCASAFSKAIAISATYPHEVVRTRMRERGNKYRNFVGTLCTVTREEGWRGLYRGMGTHYVRQVPNSCIMIGTYEWVVYLLHSWGLVATPTPSS